MVIDSIYYLSYQNSVLHFPFSLLWCHPLSRSSSEHLCCALFYLNLSSDFRVEQPFSSLTADPPPSPPEHRGAPKAGQCAATIQTSGATDQSSWYEMWEAIVAVNGICVRFGNLGIALARGLSPLSLSLSPLPFQFPPIPTPSCLILWFAVLV